jgi:L-ribulokinase
LCPGYLTIEPEEKAVQTYREVYPLFLKLYFALGGRGSAATELVDVFPMLRRIAGAARGDKARESP